jgi:uncharacterized membrane protein
VTDTTPLTGEELAAIKGRASRATGAAWTDPKTTVLLVTEVERLRTELAHDRRDLSACRHEIARLRKTAEELADYVESL